MKEVCQFILLTLFIIAAPTDVAFAATVIPGGLITTNTVWSPAGSPYVVQGDLTVIVGVTLEMQPGTVVQFASFDLQNTGVDSSRVELGIAGSLVIDGTAANPVTLQAQTGTGPGVWYGIIVYPAATSVAINFAAINNAHEAIQSSAAANALHFSNSTIQSTDVGVYVLTGSPVLDALTINGCGTAIYVTNDGGGSISNVVLTNNTSNGVLFNPTFDNTSLLLSQATINANGAGVYGQDGGALANLIVTNSIITNNGLGLTASPGTIDVSAVFNDVFGNTVDYSGVTAGAGSISANPLYVSAPNNLHLLPESPAINSGSGINASAHDRDGQSRPIGAGYDMGAYESADVLFRSGFQVQ